jgi:hypothetical protein
MRKNVSPLTSGKLIDAWVKEDLVSPSERTLIEKFISSHQHELPLYLRVFLGIGAFIAALWVACHSVV